MTLVLAVIPARYNSTRFPGKALAPLGEKTMIEEVWNRARQARKIDRLVSIYTAQILPRRERIQRLDLRYSNGFAVAWKKEALRDTDKASIWSNSNV